jgi:hypothetical protein
MIFIPPCKSTITTVLIGLTLITPLNVCADETKPLTQQLKESAVGKWLSVWGDYGFGITYNQINEKLADYPGINHAIGYSNNIRFGLRSKPVDVLALDISMAYNNVKTVSYRDMSQGYSPAYLAAHTSFPEYYPFVSSTSITEADSLDLYRGYATLEIMDKRLKLTAGRRPVGENSPLSMLQNRDDADERGNPSLLESFHYDGFSLSYAPENLSFLGSHWRVGYGQGYQTGLNQNQDPLYDSQILTMALMPINLDNAKVWFQWLRGFEIYDSVPMTSTLFGNPPSPTDIGSIDWFSAGASGTLKPSYGTLNGFADFGMSVTRPNGNTSPTAGFQGLMAGSFLNPSQPQDQTGYAVYTGIRYDLPTLTKIGFEYNYGSKYWVSSTAGGKTGTRGSVFEPFVIQEINFKPVTSVFQKTFFRAGYQYFDYEYSGSNTWIGAPVKISSINSGMLLLQTPIPHEYKIYGTFEIHF